MNKRCILIGLLGIWASCHQPPQQQTPSDVDVSAYKTYIDSIPFLQTPHYYGEEMHVVESGYAFEDSGNKYDELRAAKIRTPDKTMVIFYFGKKKESYSYWMTSFDSIGKQINKVDIGIRDLPDETPKYVTKALMENDSILEYRSYFDEGYDKLMGATFNTSSIKQLAVRPGGTLVWKTAKKETFPDFMATFPTLSLPLSYNSTPADKHFAVAARGNSWFDYGKLLLFDYPLVYKIGKMAIPGKSQAVLLKLTNLNIAEGELEYGPSLMLVTYDAQGREADRLRVCGDNSTEVSADTLSRLNITPDGGILFQESGNSWDYPDSFGKMEYVKQTTATWDDKGHITKTYADYIISFPDFDSEKVGDDESKAEPLLLAVLDGWDMALMLYSIRDENGVAIRILTINKEGRILGTLEPVNTRHTQHFELPQEIHHPRIHPTIWKNLKGPVRLILGDKSFNIAADGSITPQ